MRGCVRLKALESGSARSEPTLLTLDEARRPAVTLAKSVDAAFGLLIVFTVASRMTASSTYGFLADDWRLTGRGGDLLDFARPYNGHFSAVLIALYKSMYGVFGLQTSAPLRLVSVLAGAAVATAVYLVVRRRIGLAPALAAATALLWFPGTTVIAAQVNFFLPLVATVICSAALVSDEARWDLPVAGLLSFGLMCSGVGVVGAVGAVAYVALGPSTARRRAAVALPLATWLAWWLLFAGGSAAGDPSVSDMGAFAWAGLLSSFSGLVFDNRAGGLLLMLTVIVLVVRRLRHGLGAARHEVAWLVALVFWWASLAYSRAALGPPDAFRYQLVGSTLVVLALLPDATPGQWRRPMGRGPVLAAAALFSFATVALNGPAIADAAAAIQRNHEALRATLVVANLGPAVVPDETELAMGGLMRLTAAEYRTVVNRLGPPPGTQPKWPDAALIELGGIRPMPVATSSAPCRPLSGSTVAFRQSIWIRAGPSPVDIQLRLVGPKWVDIGALAPGQEVRVAVPDLSVATPWLLEAPGACRVEQAPTTSMTSPSNGAVLSGDVLVGATTAGPVEATAVEFRVSNDTHPSEPIGEASLTIYGWLFDWDTRSVPNGTYELTSVASDELGVDGRSRPVRVTVRN